MSEVIAFTDEEIGELIEFLRKEGLDPCDNAADLIEKLEANIQSQQAEIERLQECLQEIIDEKRLHGQVVDGIVKARRLLPTDSGGE